MILCGKKALLQEMMGRGWGGGDGAPLPHPSISLRPCIILKDHPHHLTKYEGKGTVTAV